SSTATEPVPHTPTPAPAMRASDHLPDRFNAAHWHVGRHAQEGRGERTAIVADAGELTYAALDAQVRRAAGALRAAGVHAGDRVALLLPDSPLLSVGFWGAIAAGAVAVPLNTLLRPGDHRAILDDCEPRIVVADPALVDAGALAGGERAVWTPEEAAERFAAAAPVERYADTHRDGFAFMLYSSGTTGEPKGVVHLQHDMWVCSATYGEQVLGIRP